eukprot:1622966-Amphidinium_carterae.1
MFFVRYDSSAHIHSLPEQGGFGCSRSLHTSGLNNRSLKRLPPQRRFKHLRSGAAALSVLNQTLY